MAQKKTYSDIQLAVIKVLKENPDGLTNAEICEATGMTVHPGTLTGLVKSGNIEVAGSREIERITKTAPVTMYELVTAEPLKNAEGKEYNYTDSAKEVLAAAATIEGPFSLADLSAAMGKNIVSGHTNHLVKKGNLRNLGKIGAIGERTSTKEVNVYAFVADAPTA